MGGKGVLVMGEERRKSRRKERAFEDEEERPEQFGASSKIGLAPGTSAS